MILERQPKESSLPSKSMQKDVCDQHVHVDASSNGSGDDGHIIQNEKYFIAKVRALNSEDFAPLPQSKTSKTHNKKEELFSRDFSLVIELSYYLYH